MKKAFLFFAMLLFAFVGTMRADEVTIGDPTATTVNSYLPTYSLYEKAISQQIYTADEIGMAGTINTFAMWLKNTSSYARNLNVYMKEIDETSFASATAWVSMSDSDLVGSFSLANGISSPVETAVELTTPFDYTGNGSLVICIQDVTGSWSGGAGSVVNATTEYQAMYAYRDGTTYDPSNPGVNGTRPTVKSVIMLDITPAGPGGALTTTPDVLDLGARPNGAWMAPYVFTINGTGTTVNALDFSGNYFTYNAELPATLTSSRPLEVAVTTGTAEEGPVESTMTVLFSNRDAQQFDVTATAYNPVDGDVYENAIEVAEFPYAGNAPAGIYKNYELPTATEGADAMYKVTFNNDVMLSAGTAGENAVTAIYPEDFNGQPGPMADNNYVYNGPTVNPGPLSMWFSYAYTGTNTWYGSSAGGGMMWGYKITAATLQELGIGNCAITNVETAARNSTAATFYDFFILKGGETPDLNNMVYYQEFDGFTPGYYFDIKLDEPQFLGDDENIWVMFYSDSPYAAYCGKSPVDAANSKIWYTTNLTNWYSSTTYTPMIYTRFLELPTGREVTVNLADMKIRESKPAEGQMAEANGDVMGVAKAQIAKANRGNRDQQTLIEQGFEDGMGDWTKYNCHNNTEITSADANTGDYSFRFYYTSNYPQYLISPELDDNNGGTVTFYAKQYTNTYPESYKLGYSTTTNDVSAFTFGAEVTDLTLLFAEKSFDFPAGTKYVCIACTSNDQFYMYVDDITITAEPAAAPTPGEATYQIEDMFVPAGTYYVAVASTTDEFNVDMATAEVPAPEQAYVYAPYDGETNVADPYLAEWILGDYTTEMQVLVGTQYPPQTALIDWTDYLVESAFLLDLEPNQSYFMQVNARNSAGTTYGEIIAFTTPIDPVQNFAAEETELYPGDAAVFTWDAARTFKSYNLYMYDGVEITKVNETPITTNTYTVEGLEYNMNGYEFAVTNVYDAGESEYSDIVTVYMTGFGSVNGHIYDTDEEHPVAGATVKFEGIDEYEVDQVFYFTTDENGAYTGELLAGEYIASVATEGYDETAYGANVIINYNESTDNIDITTHEYYYPLEQIIATEQENDVLVEWSWTPAELIVDFETGDFSQANFTLPATYPWTVTTTNPHEGTYCMKSTCEGIASGTSEIEVTVDVPYDGKMGFWVRVSSEANYDKFHFFIDGVEKGAAISGQQAYAYKEFDVTEGTHTYKWQYAKDSSVNSNDDCAYVDDVTLYRYEAPLPPVVGATTYNFDDNTMMGWTSIDADGDGNGWVSSSNPGIYHNSGVSLSGTGNNSSEAYVISGSYANQTGAALTPDNYLVSPAVISAEAGAQIQFWACAQDASYAAEHFGVAVSTTTATAAAFTTIQEWTMTAKNAGDADVNSEVRGTRQGTWYQYTVDLSAYAGQDIWVAIRHFNCTDMFILNVDDITLATGGTKPTRGDRSLANYILYRRNNYNGEETVINNNIASDVMEYTDAAWANLSFGEYQWGIQAKYAGYAPTPDATRTEVVIGEGATTNNYLPTYIFYNYSLTEQIYTAAELGNAGTINSVSFFNTGSEAVRDLTVYMAHTTKSVFADNFDWQAMTAADKVFEGTVIFESNDWTTITFSTPFAYNGTSNIILAVDDNTGDYQSSISFKADNTDTQMALRVYSDGTNYDPASPSNYSGTTMSVRNQIKLDVTGGTPGPQPTPGDGLSEILWSNVIEKDMEATLTFNVTTNNGQAPVGATIAIEGENNYTVTIGETGTATKEVRKGEYTMTATLAGYTTTWSFDGEITDDETYNIAFVESVSPVEGLYVSPTGWAMWEGSVNPGPGPGPQPGGNSFTEGFEGGLNGWNVLTVNTDGGEWLHSDDNLGGYDYTELAHDGTGFAMCYSYVDYVGAFNTDSYLYTPQKYAIENGSTLTFWADNANDTYPENFSVCVATADNPTAADFTQVWSGGAKGTGNGGAAVRHQNNRYQNWRSHNIDLSAYAGQEVYIAFHDVNYDAYEIWIDDVELSAGSKDRAALYYVVKLDGVLEGQTTEPYYQHNVEGLEEGSTHITKVRPVYATGNGDWMEFEWVYTACDGFASATGLAAAAQGNDVKLTWTMPGGGNPGPNPQPGQDETFNFDDGTFMGWTTIDANNDGYNWVMGSQIGGIYLAAGASLAGTGHNASADMVCSGSYSNYTGSAITPDNYLVAPTQAAWTSVSFFACAQDASYAAEHYGVAVSTTGNTSAADFTTIAEWTMTAKDAGAMSVGRDGQTRAQGSWYEKTVDLSAYAGQNVWIAIRHFNCNDQFILNVDDITLHGSAKADREMWDLVGSFTGTSAGQQAVATDGNYIYTASWQSAPTGGHTFYQYNMDGTFVEGFEIAGATGIRDLTTDGEYFYGTSGGAQIFILDFTTRTLVGTINCSGLTSRHISYDPERDGFWSGNWSTLALYSRTGALIQNGPAPTSAYGSAYYKDSDNVEHLFLFCQPNSDCKVYDYNITTGTLGSSVVLDYSNVAPGCTGIAGGCFIGEYNGNTCWYGNAQQDPNLIAIFELEAGTPGPQPVEGILGAEIFRDGEPIAFVEGGNASQYIVEGAADAEATYGVRVVYDGDQVYPDATYFAMSCMVEVEYTPGQVVCDPVTNLTAVQVDYLGAASIQAEWDAMTGATGYKVYLEGELLGQITGNGVTIHNSGTPLPEGTYTVGVVAVYASCESDMAETTVTITYTGIDENEVVNAIYPNPTSGDLHINATAMTHVTVFNAMGQMVYDQDVNGDEMVINMGQYEAGVYMVRIDTENGSSVKRITVVK